MAKEEYRRDGSNDYDYDGDYDDNNWERADSEFDGYDSNRVCNGYREKYESHPFGEVCPECGERESSAKHFPLCRQCYNEQKKKKQ